ncbi:kinase-like domain-containing protein, partial [Crepidotus variabilis]
DVYHVEIANVSICVRVLRQTAANDIETIRKDFCRELVVWRQLRHPHVISLYGASLDIFPKRFCFILPWFPFGSILSFLDKNPDHDRFAAIAQIADGLEYLHSIRPPVIHKDIKAANVLVDEEKNCVLSDFGLSYVLDSVASAPEAGGTWPWMPPEFFTCPDPNTRARDGRPRDVYSFGCTIFEIMTGLQPFMIMKATTDGQSAPLPPTSSSWTPQDLHFWDIAKSCVEVDPDQRLTAVDISALIKEVRRSLSPHRSISPSTTNSVVSQFKLQFFCATNDIGFTF